MKMLKKLKAWHGKSDLFVDMYLLRWKAHNACAGGGLDRPAPKFTGRSPASTPTATRLYLL